jgi:UDP-glucuronate 4-epimerase
MVRKVLVTGGAGFIGSHLVDSLLQDGYDVSVIDNFDSFYPREYKERNIEGHRGLERYRLFEADIRDRQKIMEIFETVQPEVVVHLAAKAGVRPSLRNAVEYFDVNVMGTTHLLDAAVQSGVKKFVFGSSSSVYGLNQKVPFNEGDPTLQPASPYAASKVAGEALCYSYNNCYKLPIVALRFFTVYGPRQRPDLAIHSFTRKIMNGHLIQLFGDGTTSRDYTFVTDIVTGIRLAMEYSTDGYEVFNLGNDMPTQLIDMVRAVEQAVGREANIEWLPMQTGDVPITWADLTKSESLLGYRPQIRLKEGILQFVRWCAENE